MGKSTLLLVVIIIILLLLLRVVSQEDAGDGSGTTTTTSSRADAAIIIQHSDRFFFMNAPENSPFSFVQKYVRSLVCQYSTIKLALSTYEVPLEGEGLLFFVVVAASAVSHWSSLRWSLVKKICNPEDDVTHPSRRRRLLLCALFLLICKIPQLSLATLL